jgi:DNA-binding transcriptional LysR family regulator
VLQVLFRRTPCGRLRRMLASVALRASIGSSLSRLLNVCLPSACALCQAVKNIEYLADPTAGELRIACNASLATSFITAVVDRMSRRYPRVVFHAVIREAESLRRELDERNVDLLITRRVGDVTDDDRLDFEFLFADSYVVAAGVQSPWVRRRKIKLAELVNEPWALSSPENSLGKVSTEAFRASRLDHPRTTVTTTTPEMRVSLLATGRFLSIFPNSILRFPTGRPELRVLPVKVLVAPAAVGIFTLKNRTLSPVARLFMEHAREVAKPLARQQR